jgi:hypothetical protein
MGLIIEDGTGSGYKVAVDDQNRMHTRATARPEAEDININSGYTFLTSMNLQTVTTSESPVYYVINNDPQNSFVIEHVSVGSNGGSTTFNKTQIFRVYFGPSAPSANNTIVIPRSLNTNYSAKANVTCNIWNGTGTGMTVSSNGTYVAGVIVSIGRTPIEFGECGIVVGPGQAILFTLQAQVESATNMVNVYGFVIIP